MSDPYPDDGPHVIERTRTWLDRAVIGLNLCPFAKAVHAKAQVHYSVSRAAGWRELDTEVARELEDLVQADPQQRETTLLIVPDCLHDFVEFCAYLQQAHRVLAAARLEGVIQLASFHPGYQFADADVDDIGNCTNRSPYPTLHLLREASIDRAVRAFPQAESIYETNIETMRHLGHAGWSKLDVGRQ
ncbi:MAG: DUF1415 domain-containing protein [Comamonadaceae bacterium]|nr:MAG: DUF1415 domain-containing protein [Comamonadaceae bacterium]